jgi:hypothetical protein
VSIDLFPITEAGVMLSWHNSGYVARQ